MRGIKRLGASRVTLRRFPAPERNHRTGVTKMSSSSTPLQESASPRFRELLKEFHNLNDEVGIMGERDRYAEMVGRLPVFDNYSRGKLPFSLKWNPTGRSMTYGGL